MTNFQTRNYDSTVSERHIAVLREAEAERQRDGEPSDETVSYGWIGGLVLLAAVFVMGLCVGVQL